MGCLFGISIECSSHVALIGGYLGEIIAMLMPDLNESLTCTSSGEKDQTSFVGPLEYR